METIVGATSWLLDKVLTKLSDELVATYVSSSQIGLNFQTIKLQLLYTQGLLHAAQGTDVSNNPGLCGLLEKLSKTADKADDMLDELHYFTIQDELDDTEEVQGGGLQGHALHGYRVVRHTIGNWFSYFSSTQDDNSTVAATAYTGNQHSTNMYGSDGGGCSNDDSVVDKLPFDRVAMSNKTKSVIEEMNSICVPISDLLKNANLNSTTLSTPITLKRPRIGSIVAQDKKLHGRSVIFEQTVNMLTSGTYHGETLSVLPIVGPGGIGKTTFTQLFLRQLGELGELGGELRICNLETVASKEEASDARLRNKRNLKQLDLVWGREHQTVVDSDVIEGLEPPPNLRVLGIKNYGGVAGPSWLFSGISMQRLDTLYLRGVSWVPPFEQLPQLTRLKLKNIRGMRVFAPGSGGVTETNLMNLKTIVIKDMLELEEWVGGPNSPLVFSRLETIKCINCPLLSSFSFLECCINLCELGIRDCPVLMSHLPPLPHTCAITNMYVGDSDVDSSFLKYDGIKMTVNKYTGALAFQNMDEVEVLTIKDSEVPLSFSELQKLNFLRSLSVNGWEQIFHTEVAIGGSFRLEELEVDSIWAVLTVPFCSSLAATLRKLSFVGDRPFETFREEQEQALYLLTSLQCLRFIYCYRLRSLPRGLYRLSSLRELSIQDCDGIQSLPPKDDLPLASLQILNVRRCSDEIKEQAKKLKEANPSLLVQVDN